MVESSIYDKGVSHINKINISATYRMLRMNHGGLRNRNNGFVDVAGSIFSMCSQLPVTVIFSMGRHIYRRDFTRFSSIFLFLFVTFGKF